MLNAEAPAGECPPTPASPWLDTEAAATYLSCSPKTLRQWRSEGRGPRYRSIHGRLVRYHADDLDAFVRGEDGR